MAAPDLATIIPMALFGALVGLALDLWRRFREKPDDAKLSEPLEAPNTEPKLGVDRIVMVNKGENKWAPPSDRTDTATQIIGEVVDQKTASPDKNESAEIFPAKLSETKKRVLAGGILFLCLLSLVWTEGYRGRKVVGLNELVALIGAWTCLIWLWSQAKMHHFAGRILKTVKGIGIRILGSLFKFASYALCFAIFVLIAMVFLEVGPWSPDAVQARKTKRVKEEMGQWATQTTQTELENFAANRAKMRLEEAKKNGGKEFLERVSRLEKEWHIYVARKARGELIDYERLKSREEWIIEQIVSGR